MGYNYLNYHHFIITYCYDFYFIVESVMISNFYIQNFIKMNLFHYFLLKILNLQYLVKY